MLGYMSSVVAPASADAAAVTSADVARWYGTVSLHGIAAQRSSTARCGARLLAVADVATSFASAAAVTPAAVYRCQGRGVGGSRVGSASPAKPMVCSAALGAGSAALGLKLKLLLQLVDS